MFNEVMCDFKAELKNNSIYADILKTKSIDEVYDLMDKLQQEQSKTGSLRHLSKIEPYLSRLREYADVIQVFIRVNLNITAEIGGLLPEFIDMVRLLNNNPGLNDVLALFFRDILDFTLLRSGFSAFHAYGAMLAGLGPSSESSSRHCGPSTDRRFNSLPSILNDTPP